MSSVPSTEIDPAASDTPPTASSPASAALPLLTRRRARRMFGDETGAATAEYAIATMAAVAFASLLVIIMRSDEVRGILTDLVRRALTVE
jgi:Flp pilus assembly pilin Flp